MKNKILSLLMLTLLILSILPSIAAYIFVDGAIQSQHEIYRSRDLSQILQIHQQHLKKLSEFDRANETAYRSIFEDVQDLKLIYGEDTFFSERLQSTLAKYFFAGFGASILIALFVAALLAKTIHGLYATSHDELAEQQNRNRHLADVARWQDVAKRLAHEFRRPLQPMASWVANLRLIHASGVAEKEILVEACDALSEEIQHLKHMTEEFASFANLPKAKLEPRSLVKFFQHYEKHSSVFPDRLNLKVIFPDQDIQVLLDSSLFRQALNNMVENALEANPGKKIDFTIHIFQQDQKVVINVFNSGVLIPESNSQSIFELYSSSHSTQVNAGIGLAVVRATMIEHGGDIKCLAETRGARFQIQLPISEGAPE